MLDQIQRMVGGARRQLFPTPTETLIMDLERFIEHIESTPGLKRWEIRFPRKAVRQAKAGEMVILKQFNARLELRARKCSLAVFYDLAHDPRGEDGIIVERKRSR